MFKIIFFLFIFSFSIHAADIKRLDYKGFTVWVDCEKRGAVKFQYNAQRDTGNFKRKKSFYYDPDLPKSCQQTSTKSYKKKGQRYDRGHLVPANHLDFSKKAIKQSNYNIRLFNSLNRFFNTYFFYFIISFSYSSIFSAIATNRKSLSPVT